MAVGPYVSMIRIDCPHFSKNILRNSQNERFKWCREQVSDTRTIQYLYRIERTKAEAQNRSN